MRFTEILSSCVGASEGKQLEHVGTVLKFAYCGPTQTCPAILHPNALSFILDTSYTLFRQSIRISSRCLHSPVPPVCPVKPRVVSQAIPSNLEVKCFLIFQYISIYFMIFHDISCVFAQNLAPCISIRCVG